MEITRSLATNCPCCCPPDGKKCFQEWIASYDCGTATWTGPVTDNRLCLPMDTSTEWELIASDDTGCEYRKYVPYDPKHCCSVNGDCTSALGDTATPDLPTADCPCVKGCTPTCLDVTPLCCGGSSPHTMTITVVSAEASPKCVTDTAPDYHSHIIDVSGLIGQSFTLTRDGCGWNSGDVDVSAFVKMLNCNASGPSSDPSGCGDCTPTTDVTDTTIMTIEWSPGGAPIFTFHIITTDTQLDNSPTGYDVTTTNPSLDDPFVDCCTAFTASAPGPDGTEAAESIFITSVAGVPC